MTEFELYSTYSDKELFNIISNDDKWRLEAQEAATRELKNRKYSFQQIEKGKQKRKDILTRSAERNRIQRSENAQTGYHWVEVIGIILTLPISILISRNFLAEFARLQEYGFKKRIRQRIALVLLSFIFWGWIISLFV